MKELILNEDKLKDKEIDDYVTRVKAIIVNDKKELLLGFSYNDYQFPGGHLEKEEEPVKGPKRRNWNEYRKRRVRTIYDD